MKQKILTLAAAALFTATAWAGDIKVDVKTTNPWGEAKYDVANSTLTIEKAWQGCGWWLDKDLSKYATVEVKFAKPLPVEAVFMVIYKEKNEKGENIMQRVTVKAGAKEVTVKLDDTKKSGVNGFGFNGMAAGKVIFKSITIEE